MHTANIVDPRQGPISIQGGIHITTLARIPRYRPVCLFRTAVADPWYNRPRSHNKGGASSLMPVIIKETLNAKPTKANPRYQLYPCTHQLPPATHATSCHTAALPRLLPSPARESTGHATGIEACE